mgnify:CR=1 FL=1
MIVHKVLKLIRMALEMLDAGIKAGEYKPRPRVIIRHKVTELSERGCTSTFEFATKPDWSIVILDVVNKLSEEPLFKELVEYIVSNYTNAFSKGVNREGQASFWLSNVIKRALIKKVKGELTDDELIDLVSLFELELSGAPILYRSVVFLDGLKLETETNEIKLDRDVVLRKVNKSDLEYEYELPFPPPYHDVLIRIPTAIVEIKDRYKSEAELYDRINGVINIFRLFCLGSVHPFLQKIIKETVMWLGGLSVSIPHKELVTKYRYSIDSNNVEDFKKFFAILNERVPNASSWKDFPALRRALEKYSDAVCRAISPEEALSNAITGLEALFSLREDRGEIAHRLSMRVARLFGFLGEDPKNIKRLLGESYKIRSLVYHGVPLSDDKRRKSAVLLNNIVNYLRKSIVFFLVTGIDKGRLVSLIDDSMISEQVARELMDIVNRVINEVPKSVLDSDVGS